MKKNTQISIHKILATLLLGLAMMIHFTPFSHAASGGHSSGSHSGGHKGGKGGSQGGSHSDHGDDHGDDHGSDHGDDHGDDHGSKGKGKAGHAAGKGRGHSGIGGRGRGHNIGGDAGTSVSDRIFRGRRPVWAREGIPEVELGRLNVGRAPGFVLARARDKAFSEYKVEMTRLYNLTAEQAASLLEQHYRDVSRIDSPVQNLALYKDVMTFNKTELGNITPASTLDLAAIFLGSASDKTIPVSENTVIAINRILGLVKLSAADRTTLTQKAETVRKAILAGHGDKTH